MNDILNFIYANATTFITLITMVVVWILGIASKKSAYISNNLIIFQNIIVGLFACALYYACTGSFSMAISLSGIFATTGYDILHNIQKLIQEKEQETK